MGCSLCMDVYPCVYHVINGTNELSSTFWKVEWDETNIGWSLVNPFFFFFFN